MLKTETMSKLMSFMVLGMLALSFSAVFVSDDSDAGPSSISYVKFTDILEVEANGSSSTSIYVSNNYDDTRIMSITCTVVNGKDISAAANQSEFSIGAHNAIPATVTVTINAGKYASAGDYDVDIAFKHVNTTGGDETVDHIVQKIHVTSDLSSGDKYNKFLGIIPNTLGGVFENPIVTAAVSFALMFAILYCIARIFIPTISKVATRNGSEDDYKKMKGLLLEMCNVAIVLYALMNAMLVYGINEEFVDTVAILFHICYIAMGAIIIWKMFLIVVDIIIKSSNKKHFEITGEETSSIDSARPLFRYLGKILISVIAVMMIMNKLGFDLGAIITGAGIVSLGITLGAQSVLSQFFSGLVLLSTRPFKKGDYLKIGGDSTVYKVRKVNVMNTELENWDNTDITIVPNSTLTSSMVKNITRDTKISKIHVFMTVAYGTDLDFARNLMLQAAIENPRVIKDHPYEPSTRVTDFQDSNIELRLSVYVDSFNDSGSIGGELRGAMYNKFNDNNVIIDYNQIVLHVAEDSIDQFH
ncbi:MAG: mechanosensitive ion channel [archaeon]|nr:mechanosensitive ion channel [archaeon]